MVIRAFNRSVIAAVSYFISYTDCRERIASKKRCMWIVVKDEPTLCPGVHCGYPMYRRIWKKSEEIRHDRTLPIKSWRLKFDKLFV